MGGMDYNPSIGLTEEVFEPFLKAIYTKKGSSWWITRDVLDVAELPRILSQAKFPQKSLGKLMSSAEDEWVHGFLIRGKGSGGGAPRRWRLLDIDDALDEV
jgi:hypothetical protein